VAFFDRYFDRIAYMHLKNVPHQYSADNWRPALQKQLQASRDNAATQVVPIFCELGEGQIDLPEIVKRLQERGYDGWVTTEIDSTTKPSPRVSVQENAAFWRGLGFTLGS
jgi:inosose dehydratase